MSTPKIEDDPRWVKVKHPDGSVTYKAATYFESMSWRDLHFNKLHRDLKLKRKGEDNDCKA